MTLGGEIRLDSSAGDVVAGDVSSSFDAFYAAEFGRVVAMAFPLTGSWAVAEELTQDAFLAAHRSWERVSRYDRPEYWVRRVATNRAASAYRRRQYEQRALARLGPDDDVEAAPQDLAWLAGHIRRLPSKQAQAVALVYVEQWSTAETAAILGCTESTVRTHLQRAREALRRSIEAEHESIEVADDALR